jgi:hypothetical protein
VKAIPTAQSCMLAWLLHGAGCAIIIARLLLHSHDVLLGSTSQTHDRAMPEKFAPCPVSVLPDAVAAQSAVVLPSAAHQVRLDVPLQADLRAASQRVLAGILCLTVLSRAAAYPGLVPGCSAPLFGWHLHLNPRDLGMLSTGQSRNLMQCVVQ